MFGSIAGTRGEPIADRARRRALRGGRWPGRRSVRSGGPAFPLRPGGAVATPHSTRSAASSRPSAGSGDPEPQTWPRRGKPQAQRPKPHRASCLLPKATNPTANKKPVGHVRRESERGRRLGSAPSESSPLPASREGESRGPSPSLRKHTPHEKGALRSTAWERDADPPRASGQTRVSTGATEGPSRQPEWLSFRR
jgi:hypothetical protein